MDSRKPAAHQFHGNADHLHNLGYIDDTTREVVRERIEIRSAAKAVKQPPSD